MSNFLQKPYTNAEALTPGTDLKSAGRGLAIKASVAGDVVIKLRSGDTFKIAAAAGQSWIDNIAVIGVVVSGTTATAEYTVLS